ncbi:MAG TPA: hypothetical protein VGQ51_06415 [Puia sp.]|nr:hypothetical protein [Puia sp.]
MIGASQMRQARSSVAYAGATAGYRVSGSPDPGFPLPSTRHAVPTGSLQARIGAEIGL